MIRLKLSFGSLMSVLVFGALFVACNEYSQEGRFRVDEEGDGEPERPVSVLAALNHASDNEDKPSPPLACQTDKHEKTFLQGMQKGRHRVAMTWKKYDSCGRLEEFVDDLLLRIDGLLLEADSSKVQKYCRYSGQVEGTLLELEVIQQRCESQCFMDGEFVGRIEAKAYCDLAIDASGDLEPVQWIRKPVGICGFEFELGCDVSFFANTLAYSNAFGACEPYTRNPFFGIWESTRLESCDYYQM